MAPPAGRGGVAFSLEMGHSKYARAKPAARPNNARTPTFFLIRSTPCPRLTRRSPCRCHARRQLPPVLSRHYQRNPRSFPNGAVNVNSSRGRANVAYGLSLNYHDVVPRKRPLAGYLAHLRHRPTQNSRPSNRRARQSLRQSSRNCAYARRPRSASPAVRSRRPTARSRTGAAPWLCWCARRRN